MKDYQGALADYQEAIKLNPKEHKDELESFKSDVAYEYYLNFEKWKDKDVAKAREWAQKALKWATKEDDDIREGIQEFEEEQALKRQVAEVSKARQQIHALMAAKKYREALPLAKKYHQISLELAKKHVEQYDLYLLHKALDELYFDCKQKVKD